MTDTMFPIMALSTYRIDDDIQAMRKAGLAMIVIQIPWAMIAPHDAQAQRNHSQTLKRLAERGGLSAEEACAVLEDRGYHDIRLSKVQAHVRLRQHMQVWLTKQHAEANGL